ncbi:peroxide stress protein YaaA [Paludibacterium paludis]|uniref:UPF0246 protein GCM10011289_03180 n=1 Tax=Paludibacterium paludis TaxID=1225769 RepID=A0A918NXM4_9NEIS|nr:peroxide stress protein YaaA [Paludibacterium paludis]GGY04144.1 UPF0246 protein [Paludibacterium paludis]
MLMVISPAKTLDYERPLPTDAFTLPRHLAHSAQLIDELKRLSPADIGRLMSISDKLSVLNAGRYQDWHPDFAPDNARQAVFAFMGDVYEGLDAASLGDPSLAWLQDHLAILSGLYGVLRPLDLMQPYRLEMGTRLATPRGKGLYAFWGDIITDTLNERLAEDDEPVLVNLASEEYFKSVRKASLKARIIVPVFQDLKGGQYKVISFHAKRARGLMARWAAEHRVADPHALLDFDSEGYRYDAAASDGDTWVFRRAG